MAREGHGCCCLGPDPGRELHSRAEKPVHLPGLVLVAARGARTGRRRVRDDRRARAPDGCRRWTLQRGGGEVGKMVRRERGGVVATRAGGGPVRATVVVVRGRTVERGSSCRPCGNSCTGCSRSACRSASWASPAPRGSSRSNRRASRSCRTTRPRIARCRWTGTPRPRAAPGSSRGCNGSGSRGWARVRCGTCRRRWGSPRRSGRYARHAPLRRSRTSPAPPTGGLVWQEVQVAAASGEAATWHDRQTGPVFEDGAETSWQALQFPGNVPEVTE